MGCLYSLTSPNGKQYLGITLKTVEQRFAKHVEHALGKRKNGVLYSALRKYKPDSFKVKTLVIANNWPYLCDLERKAIVSFGTRYPSGYNMTDGGEGVIGKRDAQARATISVAQQKRFSDPVERAKLLELGRAAARKLRKPAGHIAPWELRRKNRTKVSRADHAARTRAGMARPEVRAKVLACAKARAANPDWRAKISATKKGKKCES